MWLNGPICFVNCRGFFLLKNCVSYMCKQQRVYAQFHSNRIEKCGQDANKIISCECRLLLSLSRSFSLLNWSHSVVYLICVTKNLYRFSSYSIEHHNSKNDSLFVPKFKSHIFDLNGSRGGVIVRLHLNSRSFLWFSCSFNQSLKACWLKHSGDSLLIFRRIRITTNTATKPKHVSLAVVSGRINKFQYSSSIYRLKSCVSVVVCVVTRFFFCFDHSSTVAFCSLSSFSIHSSYAVGRWRSSNFWVYIFPSLVYFSISTIYNIC